MATNEWDVVSEEPLTGMPSQPSVGIGAPAAPANQLTDPWAVVVEEELPPTGLLPGEALNLATTPETEFKPLQTTQQRMDGAFKVATLDESIDKAAIESAAQPSVRQQTWSETLAEIPKKIRGTAAATISGAKLQTQEELAIANALGLNPESIAGRRKVRKLLADEAAGTIAPGDAQILQQIRNPTNAAIAAERGVLEQTRQDMATPEGVSQSLMQKGTQQAATSLFVSLPALVTGVITRNPTLAAATMAPFTEAQSYGSLRMEGVDPAKANRHAAIDGIIESGTELIPAKVLFKAGTGPFKRLVNFMAAELPGESVATITQTMNEQIAQLPDEATAQDLLTGFHAGVEQLPETWVATLLSGGVQSGIASAVDRAAAKPQQPAKPPRIEPTVEPPATPPATPAPAQPPAIAPDAEIEALQAVRRGQATPEQEAIVEQGGYLARGETGAPILLPAGRRRLTELNQQLADSRSETSVPAEPVAKGDRQAPGSVEPEVAKRSTAGSTPIEQTAQVGTPRTGTQRSGAAASDRDRESDSGGAPGSTLETTQPIPEDVERADLQAIKDGTASPGAVGLMVERGLAKKREDGTAMLLPAGRRRLTELESGEAPADVEATFEGEGLRRAGELPESPRIEIKPAQTRRAIKAPGAMTVFVDGQPAADVRDEQAAREVAAGLAADGTMEATVAGQPVKVKVVLSDAEKASGIYPKGHIRYEGFDISIENPKGSIRSGVSESGKKWSNTLAADYGYIRGTESADGDHIDVFLRDKPGGSTAFVIDQLKPDGKFDEHKVMLGYESEEAARAAYLENYPKGWKGIGAISAVPVGELKTWAESSKTKRPYSAKLKAQLVAKARDAAAPIDHEGNRADADAAEFVATVTEEFRHEKQTAKHIVKGFEFTVEQSGVSREMLAPRVATRLRQLKRKEAHEAADLIAPKREQEQSETSKRLADFLERALKREAMEAQGQNILEDMSEANESPRDVGKKFWSDTYYKLNAQTQRRFQRYAKSLGFEPGAVLAVEKDGTERKARDWQEVGEFLSEDLAGDALELEGTERGFVSLMKWANQQAEQQPSEADEPDNSFKALPRLHKKKAPANEQIVSEGSGTYVVQRDGKEIARANVVDDGRGDYLTSVRVDKEFRRQRVATRLYDFIERDLGRVLRPSPTQQSGEVKEFWARRIEKRKRREKHNYPLASRDEWYGDADYERRGGRLVQMTPDEFLALATPLTMDAESRENIDLLKEHIEAGRTLDPLKLVEGGREDGRHRAIAAKELGIKKVPVLRFDRARLSKKKSRLSVLHNLSAENLLWADEMGGIPSPSLAVVKEGQGMSGFGEITLIGTADLANPEEVPVFDADAYSPRTPRPEFAKVRSTKKVQAVVDEFRDISKEFEDRGVTDQIWDNAVNYAKPDETISRLASYSSVRAHFLRTVKGIDIKPVMEPTPAEKEWARMPAWKAFEKTVDWSRANEESSQSEYNEEIGARAAVAARAAMGELLQRRSKIATSDALPEDLHEYLMESFVKYNLSTDPDGVERLNGHALYRARKDLETEGTQRVALADTRQAVQAAIEPYAFEFEQWFAKKIMGMYGAPHVKVGGRRMPYTLNNIVEAMIGGRLKGAEKGLTFGEGKARAVASVRLTTMDWMRNSAEQGIQPEEVVDEIREKAKAAMEDWRNQVINYRRDRRGEMSFGATWEALDGSMRALARWATSGRTVHNLRKQLSKEGFGGIPEDLLEKGVEAGKLMMDAPVPYFEAKPQRAVKLNEFAGAVVPADTPEAVLAVLDKHGIPHRKYGTAHDQAQRVRALNELRAELEAQQKPVLFSQTKTAEFKRWFGNSKVVDPQGQPLVVYHGSRQRFTSFEVEKVGKQTDAGYLGAGFYFGDRWHAGMYAGMSRDAARRAADDAEWKGEPFIPVGERGALYPVYLSLQNPLVLQEQRNPDQPQQTLDREKHIRSALGLPVKATAQEVTAAAREAGYDGVIFEYEKRGGGPWPLDREYVAFDPSQIKSAIGNRGTFDARDADIRYRRVTKPSKGQSAQAVREAVARVLRPFPNANVNVVQTFNDLPGEVRARVAAAGARRGEVDAFYDPPTGQVFMIAEDLDSLDDVEPLFMHEYVAHRGLAAMLDDAKHNQILDGIARDMEAVVRQKADDYGYNFTNQVERRIAAEEVIAEMAETFLLDRPMTAKQKHWLNRILDAVVDFLRRIGAKKYDRKYVAGLLTDLHRFARDGQGQHQRTVDTYREHPNLSEDEEIDRLLDALPDGAELRAKFHKKPFFSQLEQQLSALTLQKGPVSQWRGIVANLANKGVRVDELEWSGLGAWLNDQEGPVTKDQVLDFVRANQIEIDEVVKGAVMVTSEDQSKRAELQRVIDNARVQLDAKGFSVSEEDYSGTIVLQEAVNLATGATYEINTEDGDYRWVSEQGWQPSDDVYELLYRMQNAQRDLQELPQEGDIPTNATQYEDWKLPGGENYRELLLTLPTGGLKGEEREWRQLLNKLNNEGLSGAEARRFEDLGDRVRPEGGRGPEYKSPHWGEPNIVAHVRFDERTDADGKRVLFVQEIQSDWHQAGRRKGYATAPRTPTKATKKADGYWEVTDQFGNFLTNVIPSRDDITADTEEDALAVARQRTARANAPLSLSRLAADERVPDAPFKTSWPELAFKRVIRWAAEENFDRIAWTTGEQQNERYSLAQHIRRVSWNPLEGGGRRVTLTPVDNGIPMDMDVNEKGIVTAAGGFNNNDAVEGEHLSAVIGDDIAKQVLSSGRGKVDDLRTVGGSGMIGFYDQILPKMVGKLTKKWGGRVGTTKINRREAGVSGDMVMESLGIPRRERVHYWQNLEPQDRERLMDEFRSEPLTVHALDVTSEMKEAALGGLPLFHRKSMVGVFRRRQAVQNGTFDLTEGSRTSRWWNLLVFKAQDRFYDLFRLQEQAKIFRQIAQIPDSMDAYLKETLYHGRVEERVAEYEKQFVEPLVEMIKRSGYTWQQVEDFLYARHAPEANRRYVQIGSPGNSGMTDAEAAQVMATLTAGGNIAQLQAIGAHVDAMTQWERTTRVMEGLNDQAQITDWENTYDHYVPLKGWAHNPELAEMPRRGRGFDTGGKNVKERTGRTSRAGNILANVVAQAQMVVIMAEKAKVGRSLLDFVKANPAPRLYEVNTIEYHRYIDKSTGLVTQGPSPNFKLSDNVVRVRVGGKDEHIVFNPNEPQMQRLATAMKNLSANEMGLIFSFLHGINRYLSTINTSLNPEFVISNALRDLQTAAVNLQGTDLQGQALSIMKNWRQAWSAIRQAEAGNTTHAWAPWWDRFKKAGAKTGWIQHYSSPVDIEKNLLREVNRHGVIGNTAAGIRYVGRWIERQNLAVENAMRLATFRAGVEAGLSEERAAQIAKNLTVNFNKRGDLGIALNSIVLFYNAGVQGTATIFRAAKSPRARKFMYGIVAAGIVMDLINRAIGGEDDDDENRYDKIQDYIKERNIIVMLPKSARFKLPSGDEIDHVKIPMPYGYNFMYYTGQKIGGVLDHFTIGNKRRFEPTQDALSIVGAFLGGFNPIGGNTSPVESITVLEPYIQLREEKAWDGRPLMPPQPQYDIPVPDSQRFWRSTSKGSRAVTEWLNEATGGSNVTPGAVDISPATVDYWIDFVLGGAGRFVSNTINAANDVVFDRKDLELGEVPFVRRVLGQTGERDRQERFFNRLSEVQYVIKEREVAREMRQFAKTPEELEPYNQRIAYIDRKYPIASELEPEGRRAEAKLKQLRAARKALQKQEGRVQETKRQERIEQIEAEMRATMDAFNRAWNEAEDARNSEGDTRDLIGQLGPILDGKTRTQQVRALREAGKPATAELIAALPLQLREELRAVLDKEAAS